MVRQTYLQHLCQPHAQLKSRPHAAVLQLLLDVVRQRVALGGGGGAKVTCIDMLYVARQRVALWKTRCGHLKA